MDIEIERDVVLPGLICITGIWYQIIPTLTVTPLTKHCRVRDSVTRFSSYSWMYNSVPYDHKQSKPLKLSKENLLSCVINRCQLEHPIVTLIFYISNDFNIFQKSFRWAGLIKQVLYQENHLD